MIILFYYPLYKLISHYIQKDNILINICLYCEFYLGGNWRSWNGTVDPPNTMVTHVRVIRSGSHGV